MKTLSGFIVCDCDARYRPRMVKRPNAYFVQCPNCGERTPDVARPPYTCHFAAQSQALGFRGDRRGDAGMTRQQKTALRRFVAPRRGKRRD